MMVGAARLGLAARLWPEASVRAASLVRRFPNPDHHHPAGPGLAPMLRSHGASGVQLAVPSVRNPQQRNGGSVAAAPVPLPVEPVSSPYFAAALTLNLSV